MNYDSFIFDTYKIDSVHLLLSGCFKISSRVGCFRIELEQLKSIFKCSNYNWPMYQKLLDQLYIPKQNVPTVPKKEFLIALPYLGKFSMKLY